MNLVRIASRIWSEMGSRFRTKFILVSTVSVLIGLLLSGAVALLSTIRLGTDASSKIEVGLKEANREYLQNYIEVTAQRTNFLIDRALADTTMLTQIAQVLVDHEEEFSGLNDAVAGVPFFKDRLVRHRWLPSDPDSRGWYQNMPDEPCVVSVFGYLLNEDGTIHQDVQEHIKMTTLLDAILPAIYSNGADKQWMYVLGPDQAAYIRAAPYSDMAGDFERLYAGQNKDDFWHFFFPGLVESWKGWVSHPETRKNLDGEITLTSPYEDAAGSGLIISVLHPVWSKDRKVFKGAAAMDFNLQHIVNFIKDVHLAKTGFAFISSSQGNVFGISDAGEAVLGLRNSQNPIGEKEGTRVLSRMLRNSSIPDFAGLKLPEDDQVHFHDVGDSQDGYVVVTRRLKTVNYFSLTEKILAPEHWYLGFVVPKKEVYAPLYAAQNDLNKTTQVILYGQIAIALATLLLVFMGVVGVSRSMTSGLIALSAGATEIQKKNYNVSVEVESRDEIGKLGAAFNVMAKEIREYTQNLEGLVQARTMDLAKANEKIMALNEALKEENIRLGAELDVAKQLQSMVLPKKNELEGISELEIAGYMEPADEVGGDYYDVLRQNGLVKIGIGDVTGHGLESGVVMLMVQTAVRTLLAAHENDPIRFYNVINEVLYQNIQRINSNRNMTLMLLDYRDNVCRITGQHEEVILVRNTGELERVDTTPLGLPLGLDPNIEGFATCLDMKLDAGDVVVLHTDGITEAEDTQKRQYGIDRLCRIIRENRIHSADDIKQAIIDDVVSHIGAQKVFDDITVVVIKKR